MAKRNAGRRGRTRKRSSTVAKTPQAPPEEQGAAAAVKQSERARTRPSQRQSSGRGQRDPGGVGERPMAPWHPWPLSETLILVGAIGTIVGFASKDPPLLIAALVAVMLGTLEFTVREHLSGYRPHSALIAAVPTAILHGAVAFGLYALGTPRISWVIVPLAVDVPLYWFLFSALRSRFQDARRERVFALGRR